MSPWSQQPAPISDELSLILPADTYILAQMFSAAYFTDKGMFRRNLQSFHESLRDGIAITPAELDAYMRSIHSFYSSVDILKLTIAEIAFLAVRNPYAVTGIYLEGDRYDGRPRHSRLSSAMETFRGFENPSAALAWLALMFEVVPVREFEGFHDIDFDVAARFVSAGARSATEVKMMAEHGIDSSIMQSAANGF